MSGDEKAAQIGRAVSEYEAAKVDFSHVSWKVRSVFQAYRVMGGLMDESRGTTNMPNVKDGKLDLGYFGEGYEDRYLLNAADLVKLLEERRAAVAHVERSRKVLNGLGINNLV